VSPLRQYTLLSALTVLLGASIVIALSSGSVSVPVSSIWQQLLNPVPGIEQQILWELRLPRAMAAFVTGGLLALSGVIMQVLLRNPLADPYILGISGGAAVGALSVILLGVASIWITQAAFAGALLSVFVVFGLAGRQQWSATRLLLTGVVVSAGWGAIINVMLTTSNGNNVQSMLFWLMGDLSQSRTGSWHFALLLTGLLLILSQARALNALARGELMAAALGVNVSRLKLLLYFTASILTATAVTVAGSVGFVGLVIPHMLRLLGARDHRWLVPCSVVLGGSFLLLADSLARTLVAPQQLPVGVLTAMIGVPAFLFILHQGARSR
tara:strand:+ start:5881 stop:6861 length:981 start_codon:yes stop_codon:yes gene_type:complete